VEEAGIPGENHRPWASSFRGEYFLEIKQSEKRNACGGDVC